ncbi:cytochrome c biogenesis protein CcdC [Radiobacillus kanasensis]|uniref:CcdC family protein n=1 Tax=Radiobacillus kanasensis TaxID=2844358 RepID=UPI001E37D5AD|nr:cytochrome c biogenesis protein CcdC [Radiobacillus kanasensis]UFU01135.1 cytochrome c biogenesis protein CcdC [Radiobacillus kanasensis]
MFWAIATTVVGAFMAISMIFVRLKASRKPTSALRIILPPLFMSTGALMFLFPVFRVEWTQVLEAFCVGAIFSIFLIRSSQFQIKDKAIYLVPSKQFVFILIGLLIVRILLKLIVGHTISVGETSGMFFLLAFGMIITWRSAMLIKYSKMKKTLDKSNQEIPLSDH